ncbi:hypothetical protein HOV93_21710 [Planctomycetes bacterium FF15]|uniref:Uncharacterized protein n=1 Tax=Bremerella alba TaxID=980252 RepID=A0A7V8V5B4_9BACT|nr:hypothetical protein [Bremerella alba]
MAHIRGRTSGSGGFILSPVEKGITIALEDGNDWHSVLIYQCDFERVVNEVIVGAVKRGNKIERQYFRVFWNHDTLLERHQERISFGQHDIAVDFLDRSGGLNATTFRNRPTGQDAVRQAR